MKNKEDNVRIKQNARRWVVCLNSATAQFYWTKSNWAKDLKRAYRFDTEEAAKTASDNLKVDSHVRELIIRDDIDGNKPQP